MSSTSMRRIELLLLRSDIDEALRSLSALGCFQIIYPQGTSRALAAGSAEAKAEEEEVALLDGALAKLAKIGGFLGMESEGLDLASARVPDEALFAAVDGLFDFCQTAEAEEKSSRHRLDEIEESLRETRAFAQLGLPFGEIDKLSFVTLRIGTVPPAAIPGLEKSLEGRAVILPTDDQGSILAVASKRGRFALDTELSKAGFARMEMPSSLNGVPGEALASLEAAREAAKEAVAVSDARKASKAKELAPSWAALSSSLRLGKALKKVERRLEGTEWAYRLSGWVPAADLKRVVDSLSALLGDRVAIRIYEPEDEGAKAKGEEAEVPVLLRQNSFVAAFRSIVLSYGTPLYGDIDPTPFVAFFFTFLFSIMFGDLGQGAIILLIGLLVMKSQKPWAAKYRQYGPAFVAAGGGAMFMGLLVGSCFSDEQLLVPLERFLTGLLLGKPQDRFLDIMPQDSLTSMFYFFGFTVAVGVLINSTGLVINIINLLRRKRLGQAIFTKTGLAGALLFWWAVGMGLRVLLGSKLASWDALGLGIPLLALFLGEPLTELIDGRAEGEGKPSLMDILVKGAVELIEVLSYYASNTMSFLRVGAFALAHGVLSFVVFTMGELVRSRAPGGFVLELVVFLIGNAIIISLEGLIVTIQVVRLQYYEFFSKFFTQTGKAFEPMKFES